MEAALSSYRPVPSLVPVGLSNPWGGNCLSRETHSLVLASQEWGELRDGLLSLLRLKDLGFLPHGRSCGPQEHGCPVAGDFDIQ